MAIDDEPVIEKTIHIIIKSFGVSTFQRTINFFILNKFGSKLYNSHLLYFDLYQKRFFVMILT